MAVAIAMLGLSLIAVGLYLLAPPLVLIAGGLGLLRWAQIVSFTPSEGV